MVVVKVKIDERQVAALDQLAAERRQSRAAAGGVLLEDGLAAAVAARNGRPERPARAE
jgi:hypothetical protein